MSIRSGDIRDQSQKMSEIALKFGRFLPSQNLGAGIPKIVLTLAPIQELYGGQFFGPDPTHILELMSDP